MNFLAHFHLAWPDQGLVAGGLEGDYYKGPLRGDLPADIERGVRLHRVIDAYTDEHPLVRQLRRDFPPELRRFAGILIDLCFDHFLSLHWQRFADVELPQFNAGIYTSLQQRSAALSPASQRMLARLVEHDLLGIYHRWETVPTSAAAIGRRFRRDNPFTDVDAPLAHLRERLESDFLEFYPQLVSFSGEQKELLHGPRCR